MKVLQVNVVCGYGSTGRIAADIYKVLEEQGHECLIAYGRGVSPQGINSIKIGSNLDIYTHVIKTRIFDKHGFSSTKATKEFIKKAEEYKPDIVHLHNIHGYYINIQLLFEFLKKLNKPVIWTLHDGWAFTGHCAYFEYCGCEKWKTGCFQCEQKGTYPISSLMDNSRWNYEKKKELFTGLDNLTLVTPSQWLAKLTKESFLGKYPVKVINNGIDLEKFKPIKNSFKENHGINNKFMILGVASVWEKRKGLEDLIKLSNILDDSYKIVVVGVNEKQKESMPKDIIPITRTNSIKELAELYTAADVFINTTYEDNFPTTNLEALACGTPVITYNTGGSIESVNEKCGMVVEQGNLEKLKSAIEGLRVHEKLTSDCVEESKKYNKTDRYRDYIELYLAKKQ